MPGEIPDVYMQFEDFTGQCQDEDHPGKDGWIGIKKFTFGFGVTGKQADTSTHKTEEDKKKANNSKNNQDKPPKPPKTKGMVSGPMTFDPVSVSKSSDIMSVPLMKACRSGATFPKIKFEACRSGGESGNDKVPFLQITFEEVKIKTCKLALATEGLPDETIEFTYEKVTMDALWTDNATGKELGSTMTASWKMSDGDPTATS